MIDLATIATCIPPALSIAKEALGIAKSVKDFSDDTEFQRAMSELLNRLIDAQAAIIDTQGQLQEVLNYAREVERQLTENRNWEKQAERYQLTESYSGTFVYARKAPLDPDEPMHYLCPKCFENRQRSILQDLGPQGINGTCHQCKIHYQLKASPHSGPLTIGTRPGF